MIQVKSDADFHKCQSLLNCFNKLFTILESIDKDYKIENSFILTTIENLMDL